MDQNSKQSGDSFTPDDQKSVNAEQRPIVQQRATNIFGASPGSLNKSVRPKTAAYDASENE